MAKAHHIAGPLDGMVRIFGPQPYVIPDGYREVARAIDLPEASVWGEDDELFLCHSSIPSFPASEQDDARSSYMSKLHAKRNR